jgi:hypothetical protein
VPLTLLAVGIVLRGSAFVFRQYGEADTEAQERWGTVFAIASTVSPVLLGILVGTLTSGEFPLEDGLPSGTSVRVGGALPFLVGFALALFAFLPPSTCAPGRRRNRRRFPCALPPPVNASRSPRRSRRAPRGCSPTGSSSPVERAALGTASRR